MQLLSKIVRRRSNDVPNQTWVKSGKYESLKRAKNLRRGRREVNIATIERRDRDRERVAERVSVTESVTVTAITTATVIAPAIVTVVIVMVMTSTLLMMTLTGYLLKGAVDDMSEAGAKFSNSLIYILKFYFVNV